MPPPYDPMDVLPCGYTWPKRALPAQAQSEKRLLVALCFALILWIACQGVGTG